MAASKEGRHASVPKRETCPNHGFIPSNQLESLGGLGKFTIEFNAE